MQFFKAKCYPKPLWLWCPREPHSHALTPGYITRDLTSPQAVLACVVPWGISSECLNSVCHYDYNTSYKLYVWRSVLFVVFITQKPVPFPFKEHSAWEPSQPRAHITASWTPFVSSWPPRWVSQHYLSDCFLPSLNVPSLDTILYCTYLGCSVLVLQESLQYLLDITEATGNVQHCWQKA